MALWAPPLSAPDPEAPPVVADITLDPPSPVSVGTLTFTITFSHPMRTDMLPEVFFGPAEPWTSHPVNLNGVWLDPVTYEVEAYITVFTGDGLQKITWSGPRTRRGSRSPPATTASASRSSPPAPRRPQLQASGQSATSTWTGSRALCPTWLATTSTARDLSGGPYDKLNGPLIVDTDYADWSAEPGVEYWYVYRVVNTQVEEGPDSDEASAAALDDVPPVIEHTPVTSAPAGIADHHCGGHHRQRGDADGEPLPP